MHFPRKPGEPKPAMRRLAERIANAIHPDPLIGKEFDGFKIEERIGRGGMSTIYRARTPSGAKAAIKVLNEQRPGMEKAAEQFLNEALVIEHISHPNVIKGLGHGSIGEDRLYLATEYIEGADLGRHLREGEDSLIFPKQGRLPPDAAMRIIRDVCRGLEAVHSAGVIHRDVKPSNMMLTGSGALIIDFGICRKMDRGGENVWDGTIYGTINYVAPEQTYGDNTDIRSDIYSLGVSAYRAVSGTLPIQSEDMVRLISMIRGMAPRAPGSRIPGVPPEVDRIIMKALRKRPDERFQGAGEMAAAIEGFLGI